MPGPPVMAPVGVVPLLGGVVDVISTFPSLVWSWLLSPGESLDSVGSARWWRLGVTPPLGASCLETQLRSSLLFSGVCRGPILILDGTMHGRRRCFQNGVFLGLEQILPFTCHLIFDIQDGWCVDKQSSTGAGGLQRCRCGSRCSVVFS